MPASPKMDFNLSPKQLAFLRLSTSQLTRHEQRVLRSVQPDHRICGKRQRNGGRADRKPGRIADQRLDQRISPPTCGCSSRATCSSRPPTPTSPGPRSTTWWPASAAPAAAARHARAQAAHGETVSYEHGRMHWKFGGDFIQAWIYNYYPYLFGGEYYFDNVKVNPWTFAPHEVWRAADAAARLCPRCSALLHAGLRQRGLASQLALLCSIRAEHDSRHPQLHPERRAALRPANVRARKAGEQSAVRAVGQGSDATSTTSRRGWASPIRSDEHHVW